MYNSYDSGSIAISAFRLILVLLRIVTSILFKILKFSGLWLTLLSLILYDKVVPNFDNTFIRNSLSFMFVFCMIPVPIYFFINNIFRLLTRNNSASLIKNFYRAVTLKKRSS